MRGGIAPRWKTGPEIDLQAVTGSGSGTVSTAVTCEAYGTVSVSGTAFAAVAHLSVRLRARGTHLDTVELENELLLLAA